MELITTNLILSLLIHIVATKWTYNVGKKITKIQMENYYDIIQHNFPDYSEYHYLKNLITLSPLAILFIPNGNFQFLLRDFFSILPILIVLRSILTVVTIFPSVRKHSIQKTGSFLDFFIGDNHDRMFSGHVSFIVLLSFLLLKWGYVSNVTPLVLFNVFHAFVIVATRSHYTIDTLNSGIITTLICKMSLD
jgi:hypothetical protein